MVIVHQTVQIRTGQSGVADFDMPLIDRQLLLMTFTGWP